MHKIYRRFCVVSMVLLVLTSCSSGPSDEFLVADFASIPNSLINIGVVRKGKCDSISVTAKALGVDEAWLVTFEYDVAYDGKTVDRHISSNIILYFKSDGEWHKGWQSGFKRDACP